MACGMEAPDLATFETRAPAGKYGDAKGYDAYMGRWSAALAPMFLGFSALADPAALLDVGCGTGNLLAAARTAFPGARLSGIDPSQALLGAARRRPELSSVAFFQGIADDLPFANGTFDACVSL